MARDARRMPRWWAAGILVMMAVAVAQGRQTNTGSRIPDLHDWRQVRVPGLVVMSDAGSSDTESLATHVLALRSVFSSLWPTAEPEARPVIVIALRATSGLRQLLPDLWATPRHSRPAGVFIRGLDRDYLALGLHGTQPRWFDILDHEYGHLLVDRHLERLPVWLDEGLAELVARGGATPEAQADRAAYLNLLLERPVLPLAELLSADRSSTHYSDPSLVGRFYAQAWALTHYLLVADGGARADRLTAFIALLRRGMPDMQAAVTAFGPLEVLQTRFVRYLQSGQLDTVLRPLLPRLATASMKAMPLEPSEGLLLLGDFFQHGGQPELSETTLTQARALGASASATERRSLGLLRQQQFAAAEAMADEALKSDGNLAVARYVRAVATMAQSASLPPDRANRAEADLRAAIQITPGLARAHAVLGGLLATARNRPQDGLVFARRALELEPSELAHRIALAQVLLLDDQPAEARWLATHVVRRAGSDSERAAGERLLALASEAEARLAGIR